VFDLVADVMNPSIEQWEMDLAQKIEGQRHPSLFASHCHSLPL
jgi:hypothetical protein